MTKGEISAFIDTISPTGPGGVIKIKKVLRELLKQKKEGEIVTVEELEEALLKKQDTLISGENVKTVGGQSIVGKGNIEVGDKDAIKFVLQQLTEAQKVQARANIDAYKKPSTGIPASDIANGVIPDISGKQDIIPDLSIIRSGAAAGATAVQPAALDAKQDVISDLPTIRSGAALGSTSVQPVDIEDMVEAEPIGSIIPPVNPSEFATKEEVSQLRQKVDENAIYSSDTIEVDIANNSIRGKYIKTGIADGAIVDMTQIDNASFQYVTREVAAGETIKIKGYGGDGPRLWAFVDSNNTLLSKSNGSALADDYIVITAPARCTLICNSLTSTSYPFSVIVSEGNIVTVKEEISELLEKTNGIEDKEYEGEVLASINSLRVGLTPRADFSGYDADGTWGFVGNSTYGYRLLFVKSGAEISIKAGVAGSQYAFLATLKKPVTSAPVDYIAGTSRVSIPQNATVKITAPEDCYLYILMKYNNDSRFAPASLTIGGIEQLVSLAPQNFSSTLPKGILKYSAGESAFIFYGRRKETNQYFSFRIQHKVDHSELGYADLWHLTKGHLCNYTNGVFTDVCETIDDAENEMAMKFSGKADFTGGYHGDERIDIDTYSYVHFFADGKIISDLSADFEMECASFSFVQYSTLHETTNDGATPISGHPIVAYHFKRTTFENGRFSVENSVKMASAQTVITAFAGLLCTDKNVASVAIIPFAQEIQMDGDNSQHSANNKQDARVIFYDSTNKVECVAEGHFLQGYSDVTDVNYFLVWDRSWDSKYYRGNSLSKSFNTGDIIRNEFTAVFK